MSTVTGYRIVDPKTQRAKPITIGELKQILAQTGLTDDTEVILASDAEENDHRALLEVYPGTDGVVLVPFD